jgi:hypothetical protein
LSRSDGFLTGKSLRFAAVVAAFYTAALIFYLWPWPSSPGTLGIRNGDLLLHAWSMAFVARQAVNDPTHLFDANMFWPVPGALSYTETLFPQSMLAAPVLWLGGGALLAHNLVLFASIVLSGVNAALLSLRLTGSRPAAVAAGFMYAFCPFRFHHLVQIGVASYQWFPLVLLALWNIAAGSRSRIDFVILGVASLFQAMSSGYYAVLLGVVLAVALVFLFRRLGRRRALLGVAASLGIAGSLAVLSGAPSVRLRERQPVSRGVEEAIHWSAVPRSYLDSGHAVPALGFRDAIERTAEPLFPGFLATALAGAGVLLTRNRAARGLFLCLGAACAATACGPVLRDLPLELPGPFELIRRVPPADMIRVPSRFGIGVILCVDVIAALGFAAIERRLPRRMRPVWITGGLAFLLIEARPSIAHAIAPIPEPPAYTHALAKLPRGGAIELPWKVEEEAGLFLYWSTAHWQPLVNGYGGFAAPGHFGLAAMAQNFPTGFASRTLRCAGVRYVVLRGAEIPAAQFERALAPPLSGTTLIGQFGRDFLFELDPWNDSVACAPEIPEVFRRR